MNTETLKIKTEKSDTGTIVIENGKTLASGLNKSDFIRDRIDGFLISAIHAGHNQVEIEITVKNVKP